MKTLPRHNPVPGFREGARENVTICTALLRGLVTCGATKQWEERETSGTVAYRLTFRLASYASPPPVNRFSMSCPTSLGSALPPDSFITCPRKKPMARLAFFGFDTASSIAC